MKKYLSFICIILMLFCFSSCGYSQKDLDAARAEGYSAGYDDGYSEGYTSKHDNCSPYYEIDDMDVDEIFEYLNEVGSEPIIMFEDAHAFAVYAFQKGYYNHKHGIWDDMTEELIDGYEFADYEESVYSRMLY